MNRLPLASPQAVSFLEETVRQKIIPGVVAGYWHSASPDTFYIQAFGQRRLLPSPQPLKEDTPYDIGSISKVFATASLTARLIQRGWLSWDTFVKDVCPEYPHSKIQIRHLLSHTAGLVWWEPYYEKLRQHFAPNPLPNIPIALRQKAMRELVFQAPISGEPPQKAIYSDVSFLVLGFVLEAITKMPLDRAVQRFLWEPLGIQNAWYQRITRLDFQNETVAATEQCPWRGEVIQGQVHDDNCWAMGGYGGHSGVITTAQEVLYFSKRLLNGFFPPEILKPFWTKVSAPEDCQRTLGWDTPERIGSEAGSLFSANSIGHLGFVGTSLWIDPTAKLAAVFLSNRVHPSRETPQFKGIRAAFHDALRRDLGV